MTLSSMNHPSFPAGQGSTAMLKALSRVLAAEQGTSAAEAWLRSIRMVRSDLDDETRHIPIAAMHRALVAFVDLAPHDAIPRTSKFLVAPDAMGAWVRVLRGTTEPSMAFARLDATDSQYGPTTRWETLATRRGFWRGRVTIVHDPALEADGLLAAARLAELSAVPALFGYSNATARLIGDLEHGGGGRMQEYEVRWSVPHVGRSAGAGAIAGAALAALPLVAHLGTPDLRWMAATACVLTGALSGAARAFDRLRRAEAEAQQLRVLALERSLSLKEAHEGGAGGHLEGTVAAGQFRILRRMGAGATGVIYEAVRIADGLPVAIKLLRAAAAHEA
ncbi:MAG: hypothetical protein FWD17_04625, partial [Polyangiaceae bacterium]|nr:hypothetical protein [Polyangiaceae bacterium]